MREFLENFCLIIVAAFSAAFVIIVTLRWPIVVLAVAYLLYLVVR